MALANSPLGDERSEMAPAIPQRGEQSEVSVSELWRLNINIFIQKIVYIMKYKTLVLSGGATKGISEIGAVKKLVDEKYIDLKNSRKMGKYVY